MTAEYIESQIDSGKTLYITTALRCWKVNKKSLDNWRKAGLKLFKDGGEKGFYMATGKKYMFVLLSGCKVIFQ